MTNTRDLSAASWNEHYLNQNTPWDLGAATPEFLRLVKEGRLPTKGNALVPGAGRGHDAILLAKNGWETSVVDLSAKAIEALLEEASKEKRNIFSYKIDFFDLPKIGFHQNRYDLILEYTFFCAIDPALRKEYGRAMRKLLKPGGLLVGLFFPLTHEGASPPFVVSKEEVRAVLEGFEIIEESPRESVKPRAGREFLVFARKK